MKRLVSEAVGDHATGMRHFHVDDRLAEGANTLSSDYPSSSATDRDLDILRRFTDIPGVDRVWLNKYQVDIVIGDAFRWKDVEPKVQAVMEDLFQPKSYVFERKDAKWGLWDDYDEYGPVGQYRSRCEERREEYEVVPVARQLEDM